jgi:hypothetical protein
LEEAARSEIDVADALCRALGRAREASERLDSQGLEAAVEESRGCREHLARASSLRSKLLQEAVRRLGLAPGSSLARCGEALGSSGTRLAGLSADLHSRLQDVGRELGVLAICLRYGAASCGHLMELRRNVGGAFSSYGPNGQLGAGPRAGGCRA